MEQTPVHIKGDKERLEQVFVNVFSNAIKFSPEKSVVHVNIKLKEENESRRVSVQVIDQGYGFTDDELTHAGLAFSKIYTQQDQKKFIAGTGLGLYICKNLIASHGGELRISSLGPNKGSTVEILLPA